jgi:very-short-patch-repair endonuclease
MPIRLAATWRGLAASQAGMLARRQLLTSGFDDQYVAHQIAAERWRMVSDVVVSTTTGPLSREQLMWAGVLHAGAGSAVGGLTALEVHGLKHWHRDKICVLLAKSHNLQPLGGVSFVETRRPVQLFVAGRLPVWRVEPAALLWAAYTRSSRSALGLFSASVQQRLTTPERLLAELPRMHPLRRSKLFRAALKDIGAGSQSVAELDLVRMCRREDLPLPDRQTRRRDASGRVRYTDAQWRLHDGRIVVLEIDGGFHMEISHWEDDIVRERDLVTSGSVVLRCTDRELRDEPGRVAASLRAIGVGRSSA